MSLQAYQKTLQTTETNSNTEYRLFAQITAELMGSKDLAHHDTRLARALHRNKELWGTLMTDCASSDNCLSEKLRAQIISVALWVHRHSSEVLRQNAAVEPLIDINRTIMEGLMTEPNGGG